MQIYKFSSFFYIGRSSPASFEFSFNGSKFFLLYVALNYRH
jgi:hypothetical protein